MAESDKNEGEFIGSGRSGVVSKLESDGVTYAVKTFTAHDSLTKFICTVFLGAPNPYGWNRDAIACTHARRQILRSLLPLWQDVHAEVAQSFGTNWNEEHNAYELITEFIDGRHSALYHPYSSDREHETADLRSNVLRPLEKNLRDAGLKGMLWQAGYGNPSAESNFMIRDGKWIWIDLESGVPALFPLNVMKLFTFYLPEAIRNRRASFDEIDVSELKKYVNQSDFRDKMPSDKFEQLVTDIDTLAFHQKKWTDLKRIEKSVHYALARNRISEADALKYCASPLSWYCREGARFIGLSLAKALKWTRKFVRKIVAFELLRFMRNGFNFVFSSAIRHQQVQHYLDRRVDAWFERSQLEPDEAERLREKVKEEHSSPYLTDFFILIALKPFVKIIEVVTLPALFAAGVIDGTTTAVIVLFGGTIYRTAYTLTRIVVYEMARMHELPVNVKSWMAERFLDLKERGMWTALKGSIISVLKIPRVIALVIGALPSVGNSAYLVQMAYSASTEESELSAFLVYDMFARIGAKIPIFGGKDTGVEHFFNRLPSYVFRHRASLKSS